MPQFNTTELDFDKIKENIKNYFRNSSSEFSDWDYEGSGLNFLLDVMAYNTHYNAMLAHMSMSESFLDSAQIRGNIISRAKLLGYVPGSVTSSSASIDLRIKAGINQAAVFTLPQYSTFKATVNGTDYTFISEAQTVPLVNGYYDITDLELKQGVRNTLSFRVDTAINQRFTLEDPSIDINSIVVKIYPNENSDEFDIFTRFNDFIGGTTGDSMIYFINENFNGNFDISFGNNVFGKAPTLSSMVVVEYTAAEGSLTNGADTFEFVSWGSGGIVADDIDVIETITTTSIARGGAERETNDSIRFNAPLNYIAQKRAVTPSDHYALLKQKFNYIDSIVVWGGEDNIPEDLGWVYICMRPPGEQEVLTELEKSQVISYLDNIGVVGIRHKIVDPEYTYLYFDIEYKYDPSITSKSNAILNVLIEKTIRLYNDTVLRSFDGIFRHSQFLAKIDATDKSILNSTARIHAYKFMNLADDSDESPKLTHSVNLNFGFRIDGTLEQTAAVIVNIPSYESGGITYTIRDRPWDESAASPALNAEEERPIFLYDGANQVAEVGKINLETGELSLDLIGYEPDDSPAPSVEVHVVPRSSDIASMQYKILAIDTSKNTYFGDIDTGKTGISTTNYITFDRE